MQHWGVRRQLVGLGQLLFWAAAFGIAFTQWPLFAENQHTKFLHGLARAGYGHLAEDWLANTIDPLPAFTFLVEMTGRLLPQVTFYLYHALLLGVYLLSVTGIAAKVFGFTDRRSARLLLTTGLVALHAGLLPPFNTQFMGVSLSWLLQAGVANQYLINPAFQPSTFGVLLVLAIYLFLADRPYWAVVAAAAAAVMHSTYLPGAGLLVATFAAIRLVQQRRLAQLPAMGGLALAVVAPVLIYNAVALAPTSADLFARAQAIIVEFRIPHHSLPEIWFDDTVYFKLGLVVLSLLLVAWQRTRPAVTMAVILAVALLTALLLTEAQIRWESDILAFMAPWRISVFLVPVSTALIGGWLVAQTVARIPRELRWAHWSVGALAFLWLALLVYRGAVAMQDSFAADRQNDYTAVYNFVRGAAAPGQSYLIPTGLYEFRLETGVPALVTFKSHPYKDVEVIAWQERVLAADAFYGAPTCAALDDLVQRYGISHAWLEGEHDLAGCPGIQVVYDDGWFSVLALPGGGSE